MWGQMCLSHPPDPIYKFLHTCQNLSYPHTTEKQKKETYSDNRVTNDTYEASFTTECNDFSENLTEYGADRAINVKL